VERGRVKSLAQVALLCTCPGVPDLYQGNEVWDLSLVDPDNRRPVDHAAIAELGEALPVGIPRVSGDLDDRGAAKLWLHRRLLDHRRRAPDAYRSPIHDPLGVRGPAADIVLAFSRGDIVTVVPRVDICHGDAATTTVELPTGRWTDVLTGASHEGGAAVVGALLAGFPVAVLGRSDAAAVAETP
jgi:(1->4)-alpha-D-glucan 1-alpha-D-glucosylmutase